MSTKTTEIEPAKQYYSAFEEIRHEDKQGEFWYARELQPLLEYSKWEKFDQNVIEKAKKSIKNSGGDFESEITQTGKLGEIATLSQPINKKDYRLTRKACYLIAMNGSPKKPKVAFAQAYFAEATRKFEIIVKEFEKRSKNKTRFEELFTEYLADELRPWVKTFDEHYYKQIYRLLGLDWARYEVKKKNHPWVVARITNRIIYSKLLPGILQELNEINPANDKGIRQNRHHQFLSENMGYRALLKHIGAITMIMEFAKDGDMMWALNQIDTKFPTYRIQEVQELLNFDEYGYIIKNVEDEERLGREIQKYHETINKLND